MNFLSGLARLAIPLVSVYFMPDILAAITVCIVLSVVMLELGLMDKANTKYTTLLHYFILGSALNLAVIILFGGPITM